MHTDHAPKEKPTGSANNPAGHTDTAIVSDPTGADKDFSTLAAAYAGHGHKLHRHQVDDGTFTYLASRWGMTRHLPTMEDVQRLLAKISGAQ